MIIDNNYCSLPQFSNPNNWNFGRWDNWAKTASPNKDVKVYIGAPASLGPLTRATVSMPLH